MNKQLSIFFIVFIFLAFLISCKDNHPQIIEDDLPPIPNIDVPEDEVNIIRLTRYGKNLPDEYCLTGDAEYSLNGYDNKEDGYLYLCLFSDRNYNKIGGWEEIYVLLCLHKESELDKYSFDFDKIRYTPTQMVVFQQTFELPSLSLIIVDFDLESGLLTKLKDDTLMFSVQDRDDLFFRISNIEEYHEFTDKSHFPNKNFFNHMKKILIMKGQGI